MSATISIIIADDHEVVRDGIRARLQNTADLKILAEAKNGSEAVDQVLRHNPDVVMLDISMPVMNGLEAARKIREHKHDCKILMLSIYDATEYVHGAVKAGANGYLLKDADAREMLSAIRSVAAGGFYFSAKVAPALLPASAADSAAAAGRNGQSAASPTINGRSITDTGTSTHISSAPPPADPGRTCLYGLSGRERQVLQGIARGHANKEIAEKLSISVRTVESHRFNIREKTGGGNTAQLTRIATELNLI